MQEIFNEKTYPLKLRTSHLKTCFFELVNNRSDHNSLNWLRSKSSNFYPGSSKRNVTVIHKSVETCRTVST